MNILAMGEPEITILVVDDEPLVLEFVSTVLLRAGYAVISAVRPGDALALIESPEPRIDLLLSDVRMPGMTGPELARKAAAARPGLLVAFMSGDCAALPAQFAGCTILRKPFQPPVLLQSVRASLARGWAARASA